MSFFDSDQAFHQLYPGALHAQASMHWTPVAIAKKAAEFLAAEKNHKILDIGSGSGKFCIAAAHFQPGCSFYGVEQREELVIAAKSAALVAELPNVFFIHANITSIDFTGYDHFYFFNAFFENLDADHKIDQQVNYSKELYTVYNRYVYKQLDKKPAGTRLATFHSTQDEIPAGYHEVGGSEDELLKFWLKV